jgi:Tfp pilus assembly protein PilX
VISRRIDNNSTLASLNKQRGIATFIISMSILTLVSLVALFTSRTVIVEQKISNNDYRSKQAFEVAEAGLSAALNYLSENPDRDSNNAIDPIFDTDGDGIGDTNTSVIGGSSKVVVTVQDLSSGSMTTMRVTSVGNSDDNSATRTLIQDMATLDPLPNMPDNPFTTRGSTVITGSATVHNPEGHSTIWSGGDVDLGSNNSTATEVADVTDVNYPGCMDTSMTCNVIQSSNKVTIGLDVIEHDASLANLSTDEFFQNFFGMSRANFHDKMVTLDTTAANANTDVQLATNKVIWVEGDTSFSNNTTVGCTVVVTGNNTCAAGNTEPSITIINGDATFNGTPQFYGMVFVTGTLTISGNTTIHGALVSAGDLTNNAGGSLDIWYNSDVLQDTRKNGPLGSSSGSWRDI